GCSCRSSAAIPATTGAAKLVPLRLYTPAGVAVLATGMEHPGDETSGLRRPSALGPVLEYQQRVPAAFTAPTDRMLSASAGATSVGSPPREAVSLPTATTTRTPRRAAA